MVLELLLLHILVLALLHPRLVGALHLGPPLLPVLAVLLSKLAGELELVGEDGAALEELVLVAEPFDEIQIDGLLLLVDLLHLLEPFSLGLARFFVSEAPGRQLVRGLEYAFERDVLVPLLEHLDGLLFEVVTLCPSSDD